MIKKSIFVFCLVFSVQVFAFIEITGNVTEINVESGGTHVDGPKKGQKDHTLNPRITFVIEADGGNTQKFVLLRSHPLFEPAHNILILAFTSGLEVTVAGTDSTKDESRFIKVLLRKQS